MSRFGLEQHVDQEDNQDTTFDLSQQVTLHIGADGGGILGDIGDDSGTIRTDFSAATLGTTKDYLKPPINYLLVPTANSKQHLALEGSHSVNQTADQLTSNVPPQPTNQLNHQPTSQPDLQAQTPTNPLQQRNIPTAPISSNPTSSSPSAPIQAGIGAPSASDSADPTPATAAANDRLQGSTNG